MKKTLAILFVIALSLILFACPTQQRGVPQEPQDTEYCGIGCAHLLKLKGRDGNPGCEEARVLELPGGEILTCEQFCQQVQAKGRSLCPSGWITINSCEQIEESRNKCDTPGEK